ncbi:BQ2448_2897 [Microbotryum intermedium]|uniref:BQ2448_2897 protein n=1 Tax=Microbotryum intermedium TaxID=269621 RepID=A0A238FES4_9BASI|nr:BQ2448_2897 [Microbotryum intermedium]
MSWRTSGYLPIQSPHIGSSPPPSSTSRNASASSAYSNASNPWVALARSKIVLISVVIGCSLLALVSMRSKEAPADAREHRRPINSFEGLNEGLLKLLEPIKLRQFVLEPTTVEWPVQSSQEGPVPWSKAELLPTRAANLAAYHRDLADNPDMSPTLVNGEPVPRHRIRVYPRTVQLEGDVPYPEDGDFLFGMTTTVERAKMMSELWTRWLLAPEVPSSDPAHAASSLRSACMILLSSQENPNDIEELKRVLKKRGLPCGVRTSSYERYEVRVLNMIPQFSAYAQELGRPFKCDTFWLDMRTLRRMLAKYDPSIPLFVGATSESANQLQQFGRMAFGGAVIKEITTQMSMHVVFVPAGMLASALLLHKMNKIWDECFKQFRHMFGGDEMLTRCAAMAKGATKQTVTTEEKGLHQFDVPGDTTGMLQSGIPFLNLHHYLGGSWVHLFGYGSYLDDFAQIRLINQAVGFLGGDNMFKRYIIGDGRWLLVLGYSITIFEEKLKKEMMREMEHTWYEGYRLSYDDRPPIPERRGDDGKAAKQTFYIKIISPNSALFTYVQADAWYEHMASEDRVRIEVLWDGSMDGTEEGRLRLLSR